MSNIKYHFAINSEGHIIDIADVTENNRQDKYYCLNCGDEMRPRLGIIYGPTVTSSKYTSFNSPMLPSTPRT